ncbi:hypothetical protein BK816_00590 [Boudabousia tangfeifanii]|uniref:Uncharacterized protein n=1 Tax=Boudabousia tangfeifanii TaxID=1912795 RepID=A0A1D9MIE0_9ACTO|nr:transglycosylase domain-containing protein [Boudabousia tangfeifanii]AOZ71973.1 hypothetical protein BK816_00590 [Boudabousia tangfeifanii]
MSNGPTGKAALDKLVAYFLAFLGLSVLLGVVGAGLLLPATGALGLTARAGISSFETLPDEFEILPPSQQSVILADDDSVLARFYAEDRIIVPADQISDNMRHAIVAIEDRRFYQHHGVDGQGMIRAALSNVAKSSTQGASTLTQQLVKNTLIENGIQRGDQAAINQAKVQTVGRKLREANYALALEKKWSKDQILTRYLNIAPFGTSVYGVESASLHYFSTHAKDLTNAQAALLAGIVQSPYNYDPTRHPENAQNRRNVVAASMYKAGFIKKDEYESIVNTPVKDQLKITERTAGCAAAGNAAYFCQYVLADIMNNDAFGKTRGERRNLLMRGGLTIKSSLDRRMQNAAFTSITEQVPLGDPSNFKIALSAVEPRTGYIRAMAQNTQYGTPNETDKTRDFVSYNADNAHGGGLGRAPGSSFKTMTVGAWFMDNRSAYESAGGKFKWSRRDFQAHCPEASTDDWEVANAHGMSASATNIIRGTEQSINTTFAGMASKLGDLCKIRDFAMKVGAYDGQGNIPTFGPSAVIGANSVPPLYMARAYATLADNGKQCKLQSVLEVKDAQGKVLFTAKPECEQVIPEKVAKQVTLVLNKTNDSYRRYGYADIGRPAASKTGTTNNNTDGWLVGYTPQLSTAVWMGNSQGLVPMRDVNINGRWWREVFGADQPATAWARFMSIAMEGKPVEGFEQVSLGDRPKATPRKSKSSKKSKSKSKPAAPAPKPAPKP